MTPIGPDIQRMLMQQDAASGDGLGDRDVMAFGEGGELGVGQRIAHAAAGDQERLPGQPQQASGGREGCSTSGRGRGTRCTRGSKNATG